MAINVKKEDIVQIENHCTKKIRLGYLQSLSTWMKPEEESSISQGVDSGDGKKNDAKHLESPGVAEVTEASRLK
jgi:hypothetical protein